MASRWLSHDRKETMYIFCYQRSRLWVLAFGATFFILLLTLFRSNLHSIRHPIGSSTPHPPPSIDSNHWPPPKQNGPNRPSGPCVGPRGLRIGHPRSQDLAHGVSLTNITYPVPEFGSYDALGLPQTWMTFSQRYGPYGYGEDEESYPFMKADWISVNWGKL